MIWENKKLHIRAVGPILIFCRILVALCTYIGIALLINNKTPAQAFNPSAMTKYRPMTF